MHSRPLVNFTEMTTFAARKAAAINISKRCANDQMRGQAAGATYEKATKEKMRQIVMNIHAHHIFGMEDMGKWHLSSIWPDKASAEKWAIDSLHAMSSLTRKMVEPKWVPSPEPGDDVVESESDSSETSLDEAETKKPPAKRKRKEKKEKKRKKDDAEPSPLRDKHYQGRIPASLERRLKRVWAWMPNCNPPRWNTPYTMQGAAKSMEGWTEDEKKAKQEYLNITGGRGKLLTPCGTPHAQGILGPWGTWHTKESPDTSNPVIVLHGLW